MAFTITVRGRLRGNADQIKAAHDESAKAGGKEQALSLGELHHQVFVSSNGDGEVLMIDRWNSIEAFQAFASSPKIREFFGAAFDGQPEVTIWRQSDWMEW
jgi:quinol monooxygenase YgiN